MKERQKEVKLQENILEVL